ncbi:hypothetical protein C8R45DRAFT_1103491 [Mycena sanguinolenta]|nr:hypothetical protein C8R45DRAFT_1103491 [Mycena sanguinolenta]
MSAPALLAEALARRWEALQAYGDGFDTFMHNIFSPVSLVSLVAVVQEADGTPELRVPLPTTLPNSFSRTTAYRPHHLRICPPFSPLVILGLRRAYGAHHEQEVYDPIPLESGATNRILSCATFGEVVEILKDELHVPDAVFESTRLLWRSHHAMVEAGRNSSSHGFQKLALL